jgi:hypothetical protein
MSDTPTPAQADEKARTGADMIARHRFRLDADDNTAEIDSSGLAEEIDNALAVLRPEGEAVAWQYRTARWHNGQPGPWAFTDEPDLWRSDARYDVRSLFASPPAPAGVKDAVREIETLVDEYDPKNSDWYFRRTVIRELTARIRSSLLPPSTEAQAGSASTPAIGSDGAEGISPASLRAHADLMRDGTFGRQHIAVILEYAADEIERLTQERDEHANYGAEAIEQRADSEAQLAEIEVMLSDGQGDDTGPQILPDFEPGWSTVAKVEACLQLLEKRRDALSASTPAEALPSQSGVGETERLVGKLEEMAAYFEQKGMFGSAENARLAAAALAKPASEPAPAAGVEGLQDLKGRLLARNREHLTANAQGDFFVCREPADAELMLDAAIAVGQLINMLASPKAGETGNG